MNNEALASDVIDQGEYEEVQEFILTRFPDDKLMHGYLILRVLSAQLERVMGIPRVEVSIDEGENE